MDGGGTKTSFILISEEGKILSHNLGESSHYIQQGIDDFKNVITRGIKNLCSSAGCQISDIDYGFFGLPAFGEDVKMTEVLIEIIFEIMQQDNFSCGNDVEAGWAGSLACKPGINIVAGTGAIGFGRDSSGNSARASGWGYFCGDEGSAYWIAKKMLSLFGKEADGRLERTPIYNIIREEFALERDLDFISKIYDEVGLTRDAIAALAPLLSRAANRGDSQAKRIFAEAAKEHSLTVRAIINKLDFSDKEVEVSYSGGVFKAGSHILAPFKKFLDEDNIKIFRPRLEPVTGAALYAQLIHNEKNNLTYYRRNYNKIVDNLQSEEDKCF